MWNQPLTHLFRPLADPKRNVPDPFLFVHQNQLFHTFFNVRHFSAIFAHFRKFSLVRFLNSGSSGQKKKHMYRKENFVPDPILKSRTRHIVFKKVRV